MKQQNKNAFTLIEILIVISLIALIALLATTNITFFNRFIVRSEISRLHTTCRYLQQCAITTGKAQKLVFDVQQKSYQYEQCRQVLPSQVSFGIIPNALGPPGSAKRPIQKVITFSNNTIVFYPTGVISAGTVYLVDNAQHVMYALSNAVSQVSYLRMYQYDGTWHLLSHMQQTEN